MTDLEKIKGRVRKLLALSKSDNENEAIAALEKANELMGTYGLDTSGIRYESAGVHSTKTYVPWRTAIANAVSWLYSCFVYRDRKGSMIFTGESLDAFMAAEMFRYLAASVERTAKKSIRKNAKYVFRNSFKCGAAHRLYDKITELGERCSWSPHRNARIEAVTAYVKKSVEIVSPQSKKKRIDTTAYTKGQSAADGISLARQAGYTAVPRITQTPRAAAQGELF